WLGLDLSEVAGRALKLEEIMSADSGALIAHTGRGQAQGTRRFDIDLVKADGTSLPVRILHRLPRSGTSGGLAHALVLTRGPGEAEEAGAAELRFARLFHSAPIAIATVDAEGFISATNSAFMRLFGAATDDGRQVSLESLVEPDSHQALRHALDAAFARQGLIEPVDIAFAGDRDRSGRIYLSPIEQTEGEGEAAIAYAIDTTEQRALEMQIAQGQKMQAVGQLAGGIAHDFNNLLTAMIGFSDLLLLRHRPGDQSFADIMQIKQNANRAANLVRQLLAFSRQQTLQPKVLNVTDVLAELAHLLRRLIGEAIEFKVVHGRGLGTIRADQGQLEQVIINLVVNARDAMAATGGELAIRTANLALPHERRIGGDVMPAGRYVTIEVSDTGCGIPKEIMGRIFDPFFSTKEVGEGTGLGLATVYGIVKQTGGFVGVESSVGRGTTFSIHLPEHLAAPGPAVLEASENRDLSGIGKVMLVEDEDAVRAFSARVL
ncbi:MAG: ATP-binding protein, partial [Tistlia sp.]